MMMDMTMMMMQNSLRAESTKDLRKNEYLQKEIKSDDYR